MSVQRKLTAKDVATLAQIVITAGTVGVCAVIVAIPLARVAFRISVWLGVAVITVAATIAISPLHALLEFMPEKEK